MFLLDTNVISELRKKGSSRVNASVVRWEQSVPAENLYLSVTVVFELELGILQLERRDPRQGAALRKWLDESGLPEFSSRILPIDLSTARQAAALHVPNHGPNRDTLIAATALVHRMTVVTRYVADFVPTGVPILNPGEF
jgi:predicted nucleic acid-binding protein